MGTINPRARGGASLSSELRASRDDRQQMRRLFTASQKPSPPPAAAAGGGISGVTRCDAWDRTVDTAGSDSTMQGIDWNFSSLYGSEGPTVTTGADPHAVFVADAGWYMATLNFNVAWSASPVRLGANITFSGDNSDFPTDWSPIYAPMSGSFAQVRLSLRSPWVLLPAGGWFRPSLGWSSAALSSFHHFTLDITRG